MRRQKDTDPWFPLGLQLKIILTVCTSRLRTNVEIQIDYLKMFQTILFERESYSRTVLLSFYSRMTFLMIFMTTPMKSQFINLFCVMYKWQRRSRVIFYLELFCTDKYFFPLKLNIAIQNIFFINTSLFIVSLHIIYLNSTNFINWCCNKVNNSSVYFF